MSVSHRVYEDIEPGLDFFSGENHSRCHCNLCKFQIFPGGGMPPDPPRKSCFTAPCYFDILKMIMPITACYLPLFCK